MKGNKPAKTQKGEDRAEVVTEAPACAPLSPRPRLFVAMMLGFVVWVGVLLGLYFKTVYPMRHAETTATATK